MFISANNLEMFVEDRSASDDNIILFLHGYPFNHSMWRHQLWFFGSIARCLSPDLRGHGSTYETGQPLPTDQVTIDLMADDIIAMLKAIEQLPEKITICGMSMGGYIALALWRKIPQQISHLILADTKATPDSSEARERRQVQAQQVKTSGVPSIAGGMLDTLLIEENRTNSIGMEVRRMIESTSVEGAVNTLHALAERPDSTDTLATIKVPTLVIVGAEDKITPIQDAEYMLQRLERKAPLAVIPRAGHLSPLENPDAFNLAMSNFLQLRA